MSLSAWLDALDDGIYYEDCDGEDMFIEALEDGVFEHMRKTRYDKARSMLTDMWMNGAL